jgi:hypothetical protein
MDRSPDLFWFLPHLLGGNLYALAGGSQDATEDQTIRIYLSTDGVSSFDDVATQQNASVGAPALAIACGVYYLPRAAGRSSCFNAVVTTTLTSYTTTSKATGSHNGGCYCPKPCLLAGHTGPHRTRERAISPLAR